MIPEEVERLLNAMLATTVGRDLISSEEIQDFVLDLRQAFSREPEPVG